MRKTSVLKLSSKPNILELTIDFRVIFIVFKLDPSSLTKNNFCPQCIIVQQFYQIFNQSSSNNMYWLKKTKGNVLLLLIMY
jgi:hypothetical protein